MQKTKKVQSVLPKNIQLTLITLASIALVLLTISTIAVLIRVYPHGILFSQFTFMIVSYLLLPVLLFGIAYLKSRAVAPRFDRVFYALLLTIAGIGINTIVTVLERLVSQHTTLYQSSLFINGGMIALPLVVTLVLFAGLLYLLRNHKKNTDSSDVLQQAIIVILSLAFVADALFNVTSLVMQHIGSKNIMNLLTHPQLILPVVLPLAFFATAYLALQKLTTMRRLYTAFVYAVVGAIVIFITRTLFDIYAGILSPAEVASIYALDLQTIFAATVSVTVYTFLIITHNRGKKITKKAK
jgi:hypothetical protein